MIGSGFLTAYRTHDDPATTVLPDTTYRIAGPTSHPVHETERVWRVMEALHAANDGDHAARVNAGEQINAAHESYR